MKKNAVLYHVFGTFLCPLFFISMFTLISALATLNYEYLPEWLDGMSVFFFDLASYVLEAVLFFMLGAFALALSKKNVALSIVTAIITLFHAFALPLLQFTVRAAVLAPTTDADILSQYLDFDLLTSLSNGAKALIGLLICLATFAFFLATKRELTFEKPYIKLFSVPAVSALISSAALIVFTTLSFVLLENYSASAWIMLAKEILFYAVCYFIFILGAFCEKISTKSE